MIKVKNQTLCGRCTSARCDACKNFLGYEEERFESKKSLSMTVTFWEGTKAAVEAITAFAGIYVMIYIFFLA